MTEITFSFDAKEYLTTLLTTAICLYTGIDAMVSLVIRCLDIHIENRKQKQTLPLKKRIHCFLRGRRQAIARQ